MGDHYHSWKTVFVILQRDKVLSNGSRAAEIKYKRCACGKVLL